MYRLLNNDMKKIFSKAQRSAV